MNTESTEDFTRRILDALHEGDSEYNVITLRDALDKRDKERAHEDQVFRVMPEPGGPMANVRVTISFVTIEPLNERCEHGKDVSHLFETEDGTRHRIMLGGECPADHLLLGAEMAVHGVRSVVGQLGVNPDLISIKKILVEVTD